MDFGALNPQQQQQQQQLAYQYQQMQQQLQQLQQQVQQPHQNVEYLSQRVSELTAEKAGLSQELTESREELSRVQQQLQETQENARLLEEGQGYLVEKYKQTVGEYHNRLRKAREDTAMMAEQQNTLNGQNQQLQLLLQQHQQQQKQQQQQQQNSSLFSDAGGRPDIAHLMKATNDLQQAIDEKNELIDLLGGQLQHMQRTAAELRIRQEETEKDLDRTREELQHERKARLAATGTSGVPVESGLLSEVRQVLEVRCDAQEHALRGLLEEVQSLRKDFGTKQQYQPLPVSPSVPAKNTHTQSLTSHFHTQPSFPQTAPPPKDRLAMPDPGLASNYPPQPTTSPIRPRTPSPLSRLASLTSSAVVPSQHQFHQINYRGLNPPAVPLVAAVATAPPGPVVPTNPSVSAVSTPSTALRPRAIFSPPKPPPPKV